MGNPRRPEGRNTDEVRTRNLKSMHQITEAFNTGNTEGIDKVVSDNLVDRTPGLRTIPGREGIKQQVKLFRELFPDVKFEEEMVIAEGNMLFLRWNMTGTFTRGRLFGREATGRKIDFHGHEILVFDDAGTITEHYDTFNAMTFLDQLGLMDERMLERLRVAGLLSASDKGSLALVETISQ